MRNKIKYQDQEVSYASGTAAGTRNTSFDVDASFQRCTGIRLLEISDGNLGNDYKVGLTDNKGAILEIVNKTLLESSDGVAPDDKFLSVNFPITNKMNLQIVTQNDATTSSDALNFFVQLRLEDPIED